MSWLKGIAEWVEENTAFVSVPFSWLLDDAYSICARWKALGYHVRIGGPAVSLRPDFQTDTPVAQIGGEANALVHHNNDAVFTSRGCPNRCAFCAVPKIEPDFYELDDWEPKPIVCDNNLTATSKRHFDKVIDRLKPLRDVDFNQGLDARLLTWHHAERLRELRLRVVRLSWDYIDDESKVMDAISRLQSAGFPARKIFVYVLIGYDDPQDTPDSALYRGEMIKAMGAWATMMRFQPLQAKAKNEFVAQNWTEEGLQTMCRYWNRQIWLRKVPFVEYTHKRPRLIVAAQMPLGALGDI